MQIDMLEGRLIITRPSSRRAGALCRVTRETPARLYVEVLDWGGREGERIRSSYHSAVSGRSEKSYVVLEDVAFDGVTRSTYAEYKRLFYAREDALEAARWAADTAYKAGLEALFAPAGAGEGGEE